MKDGLKPCPFCGGEVEMHYTGSSDWEVTCRTCPVETKFWVSAQKHGYGEGERLEAMRRWNTRCTEAVGRDAEQQAIDFEEAARDHRDAERYRWLRENWEAFVRRLPYEGELETAIDAAMSSQSAPVRKE